MHLVLLAPTHRSFIHSFLNNVEMECLPDGSWGAPWIGILIQEYLTKGFNVTAITLTVAINNDYTIKKIKNGSFEWIVIPYRPHSVRFNQLKIGRILDFYKFERINILKCINELKPDFIHAHWSYYYASVAINSRIPYLVTIHDNAFKVFQYFKSIYRFLLFIMAEKNLKKIKFASTVSPYMFDYVKNKCKSVVIIPNPLPMKLNEKTFEGISLLLTKNGIINIVMINNGWNNMKNVKKGILAFKILQETYPNTILNLYGNGYEIDGPANLFANSVGVKNVKFNGPLPHDRIVKIIQEANIFLHTSLEESFGVVLIEAMCFGIPVIGGKNSGAVPWVVNDADLLTDVNDEKEISNLIIKLIVDKEFYRDKSISCYKNVSERFSSKKVSELYVDKYNEILNLEKLN